MKDVNPGNSKSLQFTRVLCLSVILCYSSLITADEAVPPTTDESLSIRGAYIGYSFGNASPDSANFETARADSYHVGYRFPYLSSEISYTPFERFTHQQTGATDIHVWSVGLTAIPYFEFNPWFSVEALLGLQRWEAKARFLGVHFGSDDGTSRMLGLGARVQFMNGWAGTLRLQKIIDVSGTDIRQIALGVQYVFH